MHTIKYQLVLAILTLLITSACFVPIVKAQLTSSDIATSAVMIENVENGDIVCTVEGGNKKCDLSYNPSMYGVVTATPAAAIVDESLEGSRLVVTKGVAEVKVSSINGAINEGDFITSSQIPGVGMKATLGGYFLGVALEGYSSETPGIIQVMVNIHPAAASSNVRGNLVQLLRQGTSVPLFNPLDSFRYLLAILIVLISFSLGLIYFGRASTKGLEAIGRNPLARRVIQLTILLNVSLTLIIIGVGIGIAYLILIL